MEQQNASASKTLRIEIPEMFAMSQRNYEWEEFKYEVPHRYPDMRPSSAKSGTFFRNKQRFLDQLQNQKKGIPGPSHYLLTDIKTRPLSGKMDRSKKLTLEPNDKLGKENVPGPGTYFKRPKSSTDRRPLSGKRDKVMIERPHYLNEVQFLAGHSPGVGAYNLSQPSHVGVPKLFKKVHGDSKKRDPRKLLNVVANCYGTFEWLKRQPRKKDSCYFGKSKRFDGCLKDQQNPAPNSYKFNTNWLSKTCSMNVTSSTSPKSVYYH